MNLYFDQLQQFIQDRNLAMSESNASNISIFQQLPDLSGGGIELRLGTAPEIDLGMRIKTEERKIWGQWLTDNKTTAETIFTKNTLDFFGQWLGETNPLTETVWLEFDHAENGLSSPGIFRTIPSQAQFKNRQEYETYLLQSLDMFDTENALVASKNTLSNLLKNTTYFPFQIRFIGYFPGRGSAIRISIAGIQWKDVPGFLTQIRWTGDIEKLKTSIALLPGEFNISLLSIDLGELIQDKIGLEFKMKTETAQNNFLSYLARFGVLEQSKQQFLLDWQKKSDADNSSAPTIANSLNHIKLVYENSSLTEAKAYLYFGVSQDVKDEM
jgi:hypothetical protein